MIYLNKLRGAFIITYSIGDKIQLQTQREDYKTAKTYAKALGKKHKVKVNDKAKAPTE